MRTVFVLICTGQEYWKYLDPLLLSLRKFAAVDVLLFTDCGMNFDVAKQIRQLHRGWPNVTLLRYHTILGEREWLAQYDHIFYLDVDALLVAPLGDVYSDGITACLHEGFIGRAGTPEEDKRSAACLSMKQIRKYYTGCFVGGTSSAFLSMAEALCQTIDADIANNFIARWHDESHLNRYLYDHPPAKELGADYNSHVRRPSAVIIRVDKRTPCRPAVNGKQPFDARNAAWSATS